MPPSQLALSSDAVFDESPIGMVQLDAGGRILAANRAFAALAGAQASSLTRRPLADLFGPGHADAIHSAMADAVEHGTPQRLDALLLRVDGASRLTTIELTTLSSDAGGLPVVLAAAHDITAGRSAAVRQVHDQKLDELGRLAAGLAHEIRSPLQYLMTSIDFARSAVRELLDGPPAPAHCELRADLEEAMAEIAEGAARIDQIVQGMNVLSHRTGNTPADHDVRDALKFPLAVARGQAPAGTELTVVLGDVPPVRCSLGLIQQVILNLLVNAVHAVEDRPADPPRPPGRVEVATSYDADWVRIVVADNGVGMSPDVRTRAPEPFFTTKGEGRGTGQGLSLVHDIVAQHGGRVEIQSEPGEGTTVTVALPRHPPITVD